MLPENAAPLQPAWLVRLRPTAPWRIGPDSGARDQSGQILHSDSLYAALAGAMERLGWLEEWLAATTGATPAVRFTSCFPYLRGEAYVAPPRHLWPPTASARVRWKAARFVPVRVVEALAAGRPPDEDAWSVDGVSGCLVPAGTPGPYRAALRARAAVDRIDGAALPHRSACLEFAPGAGFWVAAIFAGEESKQLWLARVRAAFAWLAEAGVGGGRSQGWGRFAIEETAEGVWPGIIWNAPPEPAPEAEGEAAPPPAETAWWLLSLYTPGEGDQVDWKRGEYALVTRGGRVESSAASGAEKLPLRMVDTGSVLLAPEAPVGAVRDVAPEGVPHPVYRAGFAAAVPLPWRSAS